MHYKEANPVAINTISRD